MRPSAQAKAERGAGRSGASPDAASASPFGVGLTVAGITIVVGFLSSLAAWAALAPIESAVVAPGVVSVESSRRTVQHLEGGIVKEIHVREGDRVAPGDVLLRLEDAQWTAVRNQLRAQYVEARATEVRLSAERVGTTSVTFPDELLGMAADPTVRDTMAGQRNIFQSRRRLLDEQLAMLDQHASGFADEIESLDGQMASVRKQMSIVAEELAGVSRLYARKLIDKTRVLELQKVSAQLEGAIGELQAESARARQGAIESRLRMAELRAATMKAVDEELRTISTRAYELRQQLAAAEDVLRRSEIVSPIEGTVVDLAVHTLGGVAAGGQPLMDIVPSNDELVVHATIDPLDIELVGAGMPASVQLTAFNRRSQLPIEGEVTMVSADRLVDPHSGAPYYRAFIKLDAASPQLESMPLQPGMSADVMIRTGARTPMEYLLAPITRNFGHALRER